MAIIQANSGGSPWSTIASVASLALAPFTAGTSLAWLPGAIGVANGIANGNPVQAGLGALGAAGGAGAFGNLGAASSGGNAAAYNSLNQGVMDGITKGTMFEGMAAPNVMADTAGSAAKSAFDYNGLAKKFGQFSNLLGNNDSVSMTNNRQPQYTQTTNSLQGKPWYMS